MGVRNREEGLGKSATFRGRIDLRITDVMMPGISGPEVASRLGLERPGLKVL
jgi:CheY-like chemotaxis protein